jgi:hypothetical protein
MHLKHTHKSLLKKLEDIAGFETMTVSERLFHTDLTYDFDTAMLSNKTRAQQILRYLKVDDETVHAIVNGSSK